MITNKKELIYYMECDKIALDIPEKRKVPRPLLDSIWRYEILLRKSEYYHNKTNKNVIIKMISYYYEFRRKRLGEKLTISIGLNVFGPGLGIAHVGNIVVNGNAKVGKNCRLHQGVTIGATNGSPKSAHIGDNCFIGSGAQIIGDVCIGNNVAIGAGSIVCKNFIEDSVTIAGNPARIISTNSSMSNIIEATKIHEIRLARK